MPTRDAALMRDDQASAWLERLVEELRPLVAEVGRAHDLVLGQTHDALLDGYRGLTTALVNFTRQARLGAADAGAAADGLVDETDRRILAALGRGLPVKSVARELGLSTSTVNRHLRGMRERTGTTTQFQLGSVAGALGWLTNDLEPTSTGSAGRDD